MGNSGKSTLKKAAREYLSGKSDREMGRLLARRGVNSRGRRRRRARVRQLQAWEDWEIKLLGRLPDREVARQTDRPLSSVLHKRRRLGRLWHPAAARWTEAELKLLGRLPDKEVARL